MAYSILILASEFPPFGGGISTYAAELASAAKRAGHQVTVLAPDLETDQSQYDATYNFSIVRYPGKCSGNRRTWSASKAAFILLKNNKFDIVHAVDPVFADILTLLAKFRQQPFIWTVHGSEILSAFTKLEGKFSRYIGTFNAPSYILTNSEYTRSLLLKKFPSIPPENIKVTILGVSDFWFQPSQKLDLRSPYNISTNKKIILTAARITRRKGQDIVLESITQLPEEYKSSLCYVVVGKVIDKKYLTQLEKLAAESGVQVIFTGQVSRSDLRGWYDTAWLHCMPGRQDPDVVEGLGLSYLEAAARGLPSVAGRVGGIPEAIDDNKTGILLPELTPDALTQVLIKLLSEKNLRNRLASRAKDWAKEFSWDACADISYSILPSHRADNTKRH